MGQGLLYARCNARPSNAERRGMFGVPVRLAIASAVELCLSAAAVVDCQRAFHIAVCTETETQKFCSNIGQTQSCSARADRALPWRVALV